MVTEKSKIEIPPREAYVNPVIGFVHDVARGLGMREEDWQPLQTALRAILRIVILNRAAEPEQTIDLSISESDEKVTIEIHNRGIPILLGLNSCETSADAEVRREFQEASRCVDELSIENQGRQGQVLTLKKRLGEGAFKKTFAPETTQSAPADVPDADISIRRLAPGEAGALSQLFYFVYGYNYINETVYYPEKLKTMMEEGRLISTAAALPDGRVLGHVGLVRWANSPPVYEAALGLVDPRFQSRGLFAKIFQKTMETVSSVPMQYLFFDFVTNHALTQKFISRYGTRDLALFVGCQRRETQASLEKLGLGPDPEGMDRYTILLSVIPQTPHPFGTEITLPESIGGPIGYLLKPLGLRWIPSPRFDPLPIGGDYKVRAQPLQKAVIFDLIQPGRNAVESLTEDWHRLLRDGYEYAAVEVPPNTPGLGALYDMLSERGFFLSGFVPYHFSDRLGLRFQDASPAQVAYEHIKLATPAAKKLLEVVQQDQKRRCPV